MAKFDPMSDADNIRLNKFLSEAGYCSRREADKLIDQGQITVNGRKPPMGARVTAKDVVRVNGHVIENSIESHVYIALNKPVGIVSTTDTEAEPDNIIDFISYPRRIFPVGRLDKPSEGLILLTSDGDMVNKILRAGNNHDKEYQVTVDKPITDDFISGMAGGVPILGQTTKKCSVVKENKFVFRIILKQGLNRQIRRMCEYFGYNVTRLKRTRIMHIELDLAQGQWRDLKPDELEKLFELTASSSKTPKQTPPKKKKKKPASSGKPNHFGNKKGRPKGKGRGKGKPSKKRRR